jgi:hypothetical protein
VRPGARKPGPKGSASIAFSRNFRVLLADGGHSGTNRTSRGTLKLAIRPVQNPMIASAVACAPGFSSTKATGTSARRASGRPTTLHSVTAGCVPTSVSISCAATVSPPTLSMSPSRPRNISDPSASGDPRSPVWNQPSRNASAVLTGSLQCPVGSENPRTVIAPIPSGPQMRPSGATIRTASPSKGLPGRFGARPVVIRGKARRHRPRCSGHAAGADLHGVRHPGAQHLAHRQRLHRPVAVHQPHRRPIPPRGDTSWW